jgi:class 3 adenylate cyclase
MPRTVVGSLDQSGEAGELKLYNPNMVKLARAQVSRITLIALITLITLITLISQVENEKQRLPQHLPPKISVPRVADNSTLDAQVDDIIWSNPRKSKELFFALCDLRMQPSMTDEIERKIDSVIAQDFVTRRAVLFQKFRLEQVTAQRGIDEMLKLLVVIRSVLAPLFIEFGAEVYEAHSIFLAMFSSAEDALRCSFATRVTIVRHNAKAIEEHRERDVIPIGGAGIHVSDVLVVPMTDIHWGDAVNLAGRLALDDQNKSHDIMISSEAKSEVEATPSGSDFASRVFVFTSSTFVLEKELVNVFLVVSRGLADVRSLPSSRRRQQASLSVLFSSATKVIRGNRAALVCDMRGLTVGVRMHGIIHMAALILKMRALFKSRLADFQAEEIFTEADNYFVVFPSPMAALSCALMSESAIADYNRSVRADVNLKLFFLYIIYYWQQL